MTSPMKDSGVDWIGKIPEEWKITPNKYLMKKVKDICKRYTGETILSLTLNGVVVRNLGNGGKMPSSFDGYQFVYPSNLLMCLFDYDVTPRCIGLINTHGITSPAYSQFVVVGDNSPRYYCYLYLAMDNDKILLSYCKNLRHSLTEEQLGGIRVVQPPIAEQLQIADFLDKTCNEIDKLSTDIQSQIDKLAEYKKSIITHAVTKGLDPNVQMKDSGVDWIGKIPEEWGIAKAKYYFTNDKEAAGALADQLPRLALTLNGVVDRPKDDANGLQPKEFTGYQIFDRNDLVFKLIDLQNISTSRVGLVPKRGIMSGAYIRLIGRATISPNYSQYFYLSMWHRQIFNKLGDDGVRSSLSVSDLLNLPITAPPLDEQKQIADYLDDKCSDIDGVIKIKKKQLDKLAEYKKSIIYEYTTGKKRIKE